MNTETQSIPLLIGPTDQFSELRSALDHLGYTESAICRRTGIDSMFEFRTIREDRKTGIEMNDALDALIRLLMDEEVLSETELRRLLPAGTLECMERLGVVEKIGAASWYATVVLYPVAGLYVASDRTFLPGGTEPRDLPADCVYAAITGNTGRFLSFLPQDACEDFLDLCAGTGVGALVAGRRFAKRAWAADLGHRCAHFAEFNRLLNGLDDVVSVQGDLYGAVGDRQFDRIVAHPPYVPSQDRQLLFRDGGEDGEQILARIIQGLPRHLRPGGSFYCVTAATDRENEPFERRIRRWLGESESEFDVILVAIEYQRSPDAILEAVVKGQGRLGELGPVSQLFRKLKVTGSFYGAVLLQRKSDNRAVATARTIKAPSAGAEAVEWFRKWETAAADPGFSAILCNSRPRMTERVKLLITHTVQDGALLPSEFLLRSSYPFRSEAKIEPWVAGLVGSCNGTYTAREVYQELQRQEAISAAMGEEEFAGVLRLLISAAFLEIPDFPLPQ
jgi:SAM-dependent methyltransferase